MPPKTPVAVSQRFVVLLTAELHNAEHIPTTIAHLQRDAADEIRKAVADKLFGYTVTCATGGDTLIRQPNE
ncbi:MAG: hypothetical protein DDT39_00038 [Firmicutes bacterium]|nr:hypothetical protein [candidate division NPL-UPA2 bacterium]